MQSLSKDSIEGYSNMNPAGGVIRKKVSSIEPFSRSSNGPQSRLSSECNISTEDTKRLEVNDQDQALYGVSHRRKRDEPSIKTSLSSSEIEEEQKSQEHFQGIAKITEMSFSK